MLKFGFEREYFVTKEDPAYEHTVVLPPKDMPKDGVLAEARGEPFQDPIDAAYSLLAEQHRMYDRLPKPYPGWNREDGPREGVDSLTLNAVPVLKVPRELRIESARTHQKGLVHYQNLYGHKRHRNKQSEMTAGLHVSVTRELRVARSKYRYTVVNQMFDFAQFVRIMDEEYAELIKSTSRRPGFYEIKSDGRVEYRSLPTSVDVVKVAEFIKSTIHYIHGSWSLDAGAGIV